MIGLTNGKSNLIPVDVFRAKRDAHLCLVAPRELPKLREVPGGYEVEVDEHWPRTDYEATPRTLPVLQDVNGDSTDELRLVVAIAWLDVNKNGRRDIGDKVLLRVRSGEVLGDFAELEIVERHRYSAALAVVRRL